MVADLLLPLALLASLQTARQTPGEVADEATITNGDYQVTVSPWGVLTRVPAGGLVTVDGPPVRLPEDFTEWFGVFWDTPDGERAGIGEGRASDWLGGADGRIAPTGEARGVGPGKDKDWLLGADGRSAGQVVEFSAAADRANSVVRFGDLQIETLVHFDPLGKYLLVSVEATNVGSGVISDVFYSREWRTPGLPGQLLGEPPEDLPDGPPELSRYFYDELYSLGPGESRSIGFSYARPADLELAAGVAVEIPLQLWTNATWPLGFSMGLTNGASFGDYDGDGWIDIIVCYAGKVFRNVEGTDWEEVVDLNAFLPTALVRYGASVADFNGDGLVDIATEPRVTGLDACFQLLRNEGDGTFTNIATDPTLLLGQPCDIDSESICWADFDGDRDLDAFLPVYPEWYPLQGPGNMYFHNLGPTGPGGQYRFQQKAGPVGLKNPNLSSKPEGAQACDWDFDGDVDLFCNSYFYQNLSALDAPHFAAVDGDVSGLILHQFIDEGTAFADYDMDGDFDLLVAFISGLLGVVILENHGDGTFFGAETGIVENNLIGLGLGLSTADWDNDGDVDFTTRDIFRRNMFVETGERKFKVATHALDPSIIFSATPAWGDWDRDGDLDTALSNYGAVSEGYFHESTLYGPSTPESEKRYVRVRPVLDSTAVPGGLETEFGAMAEIFVEQDKLRRRQHTASGHGYLSQNEYALHFGLPPDPLPGDPGQDLEFGVAVDFPNLSTDGYWGYWRVDEHVNPVLAELDLAALDDREIDVFRGGTVVVNGCALTPEPAIEPRVVTTTNGLVLPDPNVVLPAPAPVATKDTWVGIEFDTQGATGPLRAIELILDGELGRAVDCGGTLANVALWDLDATGSILGGPPGTVGMGQTGALSGGWKSSVLVEGLTLSLKGSARNHRSYFTIDAELKPNRTYRLVARVKSSRGTPIVGPVSNGPLRVRGGLSFDNPNPCSPVDMFGALVDPSQVYLSLRVRTEFAGLWTDVGAGRAGSNGIPHLEAVRVKDEPTPKVTLAMTGAKPGASALLFAGDEPACGPFLGVPVVPSPDTLKFATVGPDGKLVIKVTQPLTKNAFFQIAVLDDAAVNGLAVSNCLVRLTD